MTVETLHDALTLLPGDLLTAVDEIRRTPRKPPIPWRRWVSLAACLALVLYGGFLAQNRLLRTGSTESAAFDAAPQEAESPAAAAPAVATEAENRGTPAEDTPAAEAPAADTAESKTITSDPDHTHRFAEETESETQSAMGYCGNMMTTIRTGGETVTIGGSDSVTLTDILIHLDYDPDQVCRCMAPVTVDTETLTGIQVDPAQGFARCEKGQAPLTEAQARTIQEILDRLP